MLPPGSPRPELSEVRKLLKPQPLWEAFECVALAEGGRLGGLGAVASQQLWALGLVGDEKLPLVPFMPWSFAQAGRKLIHVSFLQDRQPFDTS